MLFLVDKKHIVIYSWEKDLFLNNKSHVQKDLFLNNTSHVMFKQVGLRFFFSPGVFRVLILRWSEPGHGEVPVWRTGKLRRRNGGTKGIKGVVGHNGGGRWWRIQCYSTWLFFLFIWFFSVNFAVNYQPQHDSLDDLTVSREAIFTTFVADYIIYIYTFS